MIIFIAFIKLFFRRGVNYMKHKTLIPMKKMILSLAAAGSLILATSACNSTRNMSDSSDSTATDSTTMTTDTSATTTTPPDTSTTTPPDTTRMPPR